MDYCIPCNATFTNCNYLNQLPHELRAPDESASDMSGKGCQLLVSPCNMSPSLSMIRGHQPQSIRMSSPQRANHSPCSGMEKVKKRVTHSFASGKQGRSHVVLPTLSLRRQVLSNGKHLSIQTQSPHLQVPTHHTPTTTVTTTIQTGHCSSNNNFKGKRFKKINKYRNNPERVSRMCVILVSRTVF